MAFPQPESARTSHSRFSLRTLLLATAYTGFVCCWLRYIHPANLSLLVSSPGWLGLATLGVLGYAGWCCRLAPWCSALDWFVLGALMTAMCGCFSYFDAFNILSTSPPGSRQFARIVLQQLPNRAYIGTTLPLLVAIPIGYWVLRTFEPPLRRASRWLLIELTLAVVDVALCGYCTYLAFHRAGS